MIVDDNEFMTKFLSSYFHKKYQLLTASDGLEAVLWMQEGVIPDIILADLDMPHLDGLGLLKTIKSNPTYSHIPVIILSGKKDSESKIRCLKMGAGDYVSKPFNPLVLELKISQVLKNSKASSYLGLN